MLTLLPLAGSTSQEKAASKSMALDNPLLIRETYNRGAPFRHCFHGQHFHCLQTRKSANWSFRPHDVHVPSSEKISSMLCFLWAEPAEKDKFYSELCSCLQSTPADDKVIILGDFNARVGQDADSWKGVFGRYGIGNCNDNEHLLLELCTEQQLVIPNTIFQQKNRLKTNWMHPRSKHWHLIDYVFVHKHNLKDIIHTKVMPSAEYHTDHCLVHWKIRLYLKPNLRKGSPHKKKFNLNKLQSAEVKSDFQACLQSKFENSDCPWDTSETLWDQLKSDIQQTSEEVLGFTTKENKDLFDKNNQEIQELLMKKRSSQQAPQAQPSCPVRRAAIPSHLQHPPVQALRDPK